jgi:hypothetical protein
MLMQQRHPDAQSGKPFESGQEGSGRATLSHPVGWLKLALYIGRVSIVSTLLEKSPMQGT